MLRPLAADLWFVDRPLTFYGAHIGARMVIVRLQDGELWIWSPLPVDDALAAEIEALGPVKALVAPNLYHHLYILDAARRWPSAALYAAPGLGGKVPGLAAAEVLTDAPPALWRHQIDQALIGGLPQVNEVVFFHRESKTLLLADLLFNIKTSDRWWTRTVLQWDGAYGGLKLSKLLKRGVQDSAAARAGADRILQWDFVRVVMAHGEVLDAGARMSVAEALATLT